MQFGSLPRHGNGGFTLIELLFVAVVVAILAAIGLPAYWDYAAEARLAGHAQFALESLRLARVEAVTRDAPVSLCASTDGAVCTSSPWEDGWIVFLDENDPGTIDGKDEVLRAVEAYAGGTTLQVTMPDGTPASYVQFDPRLIRLVQCERCMDGLPAETWTAEAWALRYLMAALGVEDAMADDDAGGDDDDQGQDDDDQGDDSDDDDGDDTDEEDEANAPLAILKFCDRNRRGASGRAINLTRGGAAKLEEVDCE